jgi:nitroreductase
VKEFTRALVIRGRSGTARLRMGSARGMETWDAIRSRRDVRQYDGRPIPESDLDLILEAGRRSPSSSNKQRWDFVVVTDRAELGELAKVWQHAQHVASSAATIALVAPIPGDDYDRDSTHYDLGQASMCIMLEATSLGVGSAHTKVEDQAVARTILGFPADHFCPWLIPLGYPADRPLRPIEHPDRRPFDDVVHRNRW